MLKPSADAVVDEWIATLMTDLTPEGFRVARPLASGGSHVVEGWTAWERVAGEHRLRGAPWHRAIEVARAFTGALRAVDRPMPEAADTVWRQADRMAWDEAGTDWRGPGRAVLDHLRELARPVTEPDQLVHGDMAGNLLWHPALPPAVIDLSPYRRPAGYASAVVVVDAVLWYGADLGLVDVAADVAELDQLVLRALMFRLICDDLVLRRTPGSGSGQWGEAQVRRDLEQARPLISWLGG